MRTIELCDQTLKLSGNAGNKALSFRDKIEAAKMLDRLGITTVELSPISDRAADLLLIKSLSSSLHKAVLSVPVSLTDGSEAAEISAAMHEAIHPRLQVYAPVSAVQMEYFSHSKPDELLTKISKVVENCASLCRDVEFIAEDAFRAPEDFLTQALLMAANAGATVVTVCNASGDLFPSECCERIESLRAALPENVKLGFSCENNLYLSDACAVDAIRAGADVIKTAACSQELTSLPRLARILDSRSETLDVRTTVRMTELEHCITHIARLCEGSSAPGLVCSGSDSISENQSELNARSTLDDIRNAVARLGYDLSEDDFSLIHAEFLHMAEAKESISLKELDSIIATVAMQVPAYYQLESYIVNTSNMISSTAHVRLTHDGEMSESACIGDGPIDAAFEAIEQIAGCRFDLDDFQIQAVTKGREAMGESVVRLRSHGRIYSGRGISTDIVGSGIMAYLNAVNKILYEEGNE